MSGYVYSCNSEPAERHTHFKGTMPLDTFVQLVNSKTQCRWIRLFNSLIQRHNVVGYVCSTR